MVPYAKTGGLADFTGALVSNLGAIGYNVRAFMPLYPDVRRNHAPLQPVLGAQRLALSLGDTEYRFSLLTTDYPGSDIPVYFIDCPTLFDRGGLYTTDPDEHRRRLSADRGRHHASR